MIVDTSSQDITDFDKYFPEGFILQTDRVLLTPMQREDAARFFPITQSAILWKYFTKELNNEVQLAAWVNEAINDRAVNKRVPFTVVDKKSGMICGSTSFGNISFIDERIEIGWSWLAETSLGSGVNRHCKFALLKYAFEIMQFKRVEIKTDNLNERAKQALRNIGATEEGVLRSHMQMPHGRRRNSIYFSILQNEWEEIKKKCFAAIQ